MATACLRGALGWLSVLVSACSVPSYTHPESPPTVERFEVLPFEVLAGGEAVVSWRVVGADVVTLSGPSFREFVAPEGSRVVTATASVDLTLVAENEAGPARAVTRLRVVDPAAVRIVRFEVAPPVARPGELVRFSWAVEGATRVRVRLSTGEILEERAAEVGSTHLRVTEDVEVELRAEGVDGPKQETRRVHVEGVAPRIETFAVEPPAIALGGSSTLQIRVADARSIRVDALGDDGAMSRLFDDAPGPDGVVELPLDSDAGSRTFTLTADNNFGSATDSARLIVLAPRDPEILALSLWPLSNGPGGDTFVEYATRFADEVMLEVPGVDPRTLPARGRLALPFTESTDLQLSARDTRSGRRTVQSARVTIDAARPSIELTVNPQVVALGSTFEVRFRTERATRVQFDTDSDVPVATFTDATGVLQLRASEVFFLYVRAENARGTTFRVAPFEIR